MNPDHIRRMTEMRAAIDAQVSAGCPPEVRQPWYRRPGDILAFVTRITGIAFLVKTAVPNCGCDERQRRMNRAAARRSA